jgi:glucose-6-phosphate isomerase
LMQITAALAAVKEAGLAVKIPDLFLAITEPAKDGKRTGLRVLCDEFRIAMLEHDPGVGGRYSVLTNVGLLPAAAIGLDIDAIRAGAAQALAPILEKRAPQDVPAAVGAALAVAINKPMTVMMAYADRLERFTRWYVQLWAESLGKDGKGTTPIAARGPVDQHSQLQLFIAGPRDKLFTVITTDLRGRGPRIEPELARLAGEPDFGGKTMGDFVAAQGRATADTLAKNGCPVRTIHVEQLDETSLGALLMHFMLETIIAAHLFGVDPFDQPAVEEGKILAKQYLRG